MIAAPPPVEWMWRKTGDSSRLLELCHGVGFFYVTDHGIPSEFFDRYFRLVKEFFQML